MESFFAIHGYLANIDVIYKETLESIFPNETEWNDDGKGNHHIGEGIIVPKMINGKFLINNTEKVPFIQEVRNKECFYIFRSGDEVMGETKVSPECLPLRISVSTEGAYIIVSSIQKDLGSSDPIPIMSFLGLYYEKMESAMGRINDMIKDVPSMNTYIIAHGSSGFHMNKDIIEDKFFGVRDSKKNALTLTYLFYRCFKVYFGKDRPTDRDDYSFKILRSSGDIIGSCLKRALSRSSKNVNRAIDKEVYQMLRTGNVIVHGKEYSKMVAVIETRSDIDSISAIRRVVIPCNEDSIAMGPRQIHPSQTGYICPCETPEGKTVGLVKNLALTCVLSTKIDREEIEKLLAPLAQAKDGIWIILDGIVLGFSDRDDTFKRIKAFKRDPRFKYLSVSKIENREIHIRTVMGRPTRPMICSKGMWEYLDPSEDISEHKEIHPCTMFGVSVSMIPFSEHNHGARNIFASSMVKQAMQVEVVNENTRPGKYLVYGQRPIVNTIPCKLLTNKPNGVNVLVCIMSYTGYNQEDAIIVKRSCIDRGLFDSIVKKETRTAEKETIAASEEEILIIGDDVTSCPRGKVTITEEEIKITNNIYRKLETGDKLASRHAQKGVIGLILNEEDMPFNSQGMSPDIIINPHGIPSRMTVGQLLEGVIGKKCCIKGRGDFDGTPFGQRDVSEFLESEESETFYSGFTGRKLSCKVTMNVVYYMSLVHQVADKIYVRWKGPKNGFSNQPVAGRAKMGGLRFGEMEIDGLLARGTSSMISDTIENSDAEEVQCCEECGYFPKCEVICCICNKETRTMVKENVPHSLLVFSSLLASCSIGVRMTF